MVEGLRRSIANAVRRLVNASLARPLSALRRRPIPRAVLNCWAIDASGMLIQTQSSLQSTTQSFSVGRVMRGIPRNVKPGMLLNNDATGEFKELFLLAKPCTSR